MAFDAAREEVMFQSTPAPIGAGDKDYASALAMLQSFNPHPLRSERVTRHRAARTGLLRVSIHTRSDRSG